MSSPSQKPAQLSRRTFLQRSLLATASFSFAARSRAAIPGVNNDIRVAVIGFHSRGLDHLKNYAKLPGVRIVALCDVDQTVLDQGVADLQKKGATVTAYRDLRRLLESQEIDAVSIATPNHWHALAGIWACQAGKDVYLEKPISHNVWEGRQMVRAAAQTGRIVQAGVQSRSGAGLAEALEWAGAGNLGRLQHVRGLCYKPRPSIGKVDGPQPVPASIDYDLWCGPTPIRPLHRKNLHYDWHWIWDTGNGDLGNQGIHQMDIARRFLGESALAPQTYAVGGRLGYVDDGQTPNSLVVVHDYVKAPLFFEVRGLPESAASKKMDQYRKASIGVVAQYENGYILCPNYFDAIAYDRAGDLVKKFARPTHESVEENHYANFLAAMRSRKSTDLRCPIVEGHISSALCHLANISYRLGHESLPEVIREKWQGKKEAMDSLDRLLAHLAANRVDVKMNQLTMGEFLQFDPRAEKFLENEAADRMLAEETRPEFSIPKLS